VIRNVSFEANPGDTVALVGPTGAGKSTLLKLLLRLYDVTEGAVRVDGHDVRNLTVESLRSNVGYVAQDTTLFDGTIAENIRYGRFTGVDTEGRSAGADAKSEVRDRVIEAAKAAEAHEFIDSLPNGYDTRIGERGVKLSGGQRQRVAIARVVLQDPAILILDEAISAVDTETEMLIQRSLDELAADRTTFVIAHRLSTVTDADLTLVLEDGGVAERAGLTTISSTLTASTRSSGACRPARSMSFRRSSSSAPTSATSTARSSGRWKGRPSRARRSTIETARTVDIPRAEARGFPRHRTAGLGWLRFVATTLGGYWLCQSAVTPIPAWDSEILSLTAPDSDTEGCLLLGTVESRYCPIDWAGRPPRFIVKTTSG